MSPEPEQWIDDAFIYFNDSIQEALKRTFDHEAVQENPDWHKLAHLGSLIGNEDFAKALSNGEKETKRRILEVIGRYGLETTVLNDFIEKPHELPQVDEDQPVESTPQTIAPKTEFGLQVFTSLKDVLMDRSRKSQMSFVVALQSLANEAERRNALDFCIIELGKARIDDEISQSTFDSKMLMLAKLNVLEDEYGDRDYGLVVETLNRLVYSSDPEVSDFGLKFYSMISTSTLEGMLDRADLEHCNAKRLAEYMQNVAYFIKPETFYRETNGNKTYPPNKADICLDYLDQVLETVMERYESDELDLVDNLIDEFNKRKKLKGKSGRSGTDYILDAIALLADYGSEAAEFFLTATWNDRYF